MNKQFLDVSIENNNHSQLLAQSDFQRDSQFDQLCQSMNINGSYDMKNVGNQAVNFNPKVRNSDGKQQNVITEMQKRITIENFKSKEKNDVDESNDSYNVQQNSFLFDRKEKGCNLQLEGCNNKYKQNEYNLNIGRQNFEKGQLFISNNSHMKQNKKLEQSFIKIPQIAQKYEEIKMKNNIQPSKISQIKFYIYQFTQKLKYLSNNRSLNQISRERICLINDKSYNFENDFCQANSSFQKFCQRTKEIINQIPIFIPNNKFIIIFDIISIIYLYLFFFSLSIFAFFNQNNLNSDFFAAICIVGLFIMVFDILSRLNIALILRGNLVLDRKQIVKKYAFSLCFLTDVLSIIALLAKIIPHPNQITYNPSNTCIGFYCLTFIQNNEKNWLQQINIENSEYYIKYIYSLYWAILTLTAVGNGEISPANFIEALYISIFAVFFSFALALNIFKIGQIFNEICNQQQDVKKQIQFIEKYLQRKNISFQLKIRIKAYLKALLEEKNNYSQQTEQVLSLLTPTLREEVARESNLKMIQKFQVFNCFHQQTINKIALQMQEIIVSPGETIFLEGDCDDSIYLILRGQIEIFLKDAQRYSHYFILETLLPDQIFGEIAFFSEQPRTASARSTCFSTLCKIQRKDFIQVIHQNQTDYEIFKALQHKITLSKSYINLIGQNKQIFNQMKTEQKHQEFFNTKLKDSDQGLSNKKIEELKHQTNFYEEEEEFYFNSLYKQSIANLEEGPFSNKQMTSELHFGNSNKSFFQQNSNKNTFKERAEDKELDAYQSNKSFFKQNSTKNIFKERVEDKESDAYQQSTMYDDQSLKQSISALDICSRNENFTSKNSGQIRTKQPSLFKHNNFIENIQTDQSKQSLAFINQLDQESLNVSAILIAESNYPQEQRYHKQLSSLANIQLFPEEKKSVNWRQQETKIHKFCKDEQINNYKMDIISQNSIRTLSSHDKQQNGNSANIKSQILQQNKKYGAEKKIKQFLKKNSIVQEQLKRHTMSNQNVQLSVSDNVELQNKSLQGKLFFQSAINCLQGDQDLSNLTQPFYNTDIDEGNQKSQGLIQTKNESFHYENQKCQQEHILEAQQHDTCDFSTKQKANILCQSDSSVMSNPVVIDKKARIEQQKIICSDLQQHNEDSLKVELNIIQKKNKSQPLLEIKDIPDNKISKMGMQNLENYERAANIINNILNKSMNRVQRINKHVKNFIQALNYRKKNRGIAILQENGYRIINDDAFSFQKKLRQNILQKFINKVYKLAELKMPIPLFMPTNSFRVYWDILQTIYIYLFIYIYSILVFFAMQNQDTTFVKQSYLYTFILFLIDTLVTLNTAYFKKDTIIVDRKQIAWKYFSSSIFMADAISLITMGSKLIFKHSSLVYNPDNSLISFIANLLVLFKLKCLNQKKKRIRNTFTLNDHQKHIMKLLNQLLFVIFVAHLVCLAWYSLGQYEIQNGYSQSWIQKYDLKELTYQQQYIYSMYWSVTTMTTEQKDRNQQSENQVLQILSNKLRNEIIVEINSRILKNNAIFSANFSSQTLRKLVFIMEEVVVSPNEIIFEEGDYIDQSVYLIESGKIEIYQSPNTNQTSNCLSQKSKTHSLKVLSNDSIFGEISFFSGLSRNASARSINLSTIYKINRNSFIKLIQENQEDFERFKMMEEQIKFLQDYSILYLECYGCKGMNHLAKNCPILHQKFDSQFIDLKHNFSLFQERQEKAQRRFQNNRYNSRVNLDINKITCQALKENIRYLNPEIQIFFSTDEEILNQPSHCEEQQEEDEQKTNNNQTSLSSLQDSTSNQSINKKQLFKSDACFDYQKQDHSKNNSLKIIKSQIQLEQQQQKIRNRVNNLKDNKNIENLENLTQSERQISCLNSNRKINIKSLFPTNNRNKFDEDQPSQINSQMNYHFQDVLDKDGTFVEFTKEKINTNQEQNEYLNIQNKFYQNQKFQNNQKPYPSTSQDSSYKSLQENCEDKTKIRSNKHIMKFSLNSQDDCNNNNNSNKNNNCFQIEENNQKQGSYLTHKQDKITKFQTSQYEKKSSIDKYFCNQNINDHMTQSLALTSTQKQSFENSLNKIDEKNIQISHQKQLQSQNINNLLHSTNNINTSQIFSNISKRQNESPKQTQIQYSDMQNSKNKKCDQQNILKQQQTIDLMRRDSLEFIVQKIFQHFKETANNQDGDFFKLANEKTSENYQLDQQQDDYVLNYFDLIKNFKKFFPHNNFCNLLKKNKINQLIKQKMNINISKPLNKRRYNIFIQQQSDRKLTFCNQIQQNSLFFEINYQKYKPSFLSYGVSQKNETTFPKCQIQQQSPYLI
ncbi:hypothetical protein ABPG73_007101 [Tetrahymena malaccensis]